MFRNEILEQNPELADELLSEIDRMKDEKEKLEQERQRMMAQKEELEKQLLDKTTKESVGRWGTAAASTNTVSSSSAPQPNPSSAPVSPSSSSVEENSGFVEGETAILLEEDANQQSTGNNTLEEEGTGRTDNFDDGLCVPASMESTSSRQSDSTVASSSTDERLSSESTAAAAAAEEDPSSTSSDFSLKSFLQEFFHEFERDVHRITTLMLPVVKPILDAGSKAWKYAKIIFHGAKRQMEKYRKQQQQQQQQPKSGEAGGDTQQSFMGTASQ